MTHNQRIMLIILILAGLAIAVLVALPDLVGAAPVADAPVADAPGPECPRPTPTPTATPPTTAVTLLSFGASSGGNRGGCGMQGVDWCTVAASGGSRKWGFWVDLACDYYATPRITTRAKWRVDAKVELWGCIALDRNGEATRLSAPFTLARR